MNSQFTPFAMALYGINTFGTSGHHVMNLDIAVTRFGPWAEIASLPSADASSRQCRCTVAMKEMQFAVLQISEP